MSDMDKWLNDEPQDTVVEVDKVFVEVHVTCPKCGEPEVYTTTLAQAEGLGANGEATIYGYPKWFCEKCEHKYSVVLVSDIE